jgi:hypothetical protein
MPDAMAGQIYSGTIATNASDPNPGDMLTFAKASGPAWLTVANDGTLSGMPLSSDVGTNSFVVSVTDPGGLFGTANMAVNVAPAPPIVSTMSFQAGSITLNWSGGVGPYQVQTATNIINPDWQTVGTIGGGSFSITPSNDAAFYRIIGQ